MLYSTIEPFGYDEHDAQQSYTRKTLVDVLASKKGGKRTSIYDFSLGKKREEHYKTRNASPVPTQSVDEMKEIVKGLAKMFGSKEDKEGKEGKPKKKGKPKRPTRRNE